MDTLTNSEVQSDRHPLSGKLNGRWTNQEHQAFLYGLRLFGKNWKKIESVVKTRSGSQIRSHAQKFFNKVNEKGIKPPVLGDDIEISVATSQYIVQPGLGFKANTARNTTQVPQRSNSEENTPIQDPQSSSNVVSQSKHLPSQLSSTILMLQQLRETLQEIKESQVNPLKIFSHYFFQMYLVVLLRCNHPEELIKNNFIKHFVDLRPDVAHNVLDLQAVVPEGKKKMSFVRCKPDTLKQGVDSYQN